LRNSQKERKKEITAERRKICNGFLSLFLFSSLSLFLSLSLSLFLFWYSLPSVCFCLFLSHALKKTKVNVVSTSVNAANVSRSDLIEWVNSMLGLTYTKVENLCTGKHRRHGIERQTRGREREMVEEA
jgi:hypothetical protein